MLDEYAHMCSPIRYLSNQWILTPKMLKTCLLPEDLVEFIVHSASVSHFEYRAKHTIKMGLDIMVRQRNLLMLR